MGQRSRVLVVGLVAASAVAIGSVLTGRLVHTPLAAAIVHLQQWPRARPVGRFLLFAGIAGLCAAWWWLGRLVRGEPDGHRWAWRAGALWGAPLLLAPPAFSGDVWSYVADAVLLRRGMSPYLATPESLPAPLLRAVSAHWRDSPTPYGPLALAWGWVAAQVTTSPWLLLLAFRLLAAVGVLLLGWSVHRIARRSGQDPALASWLVVASPFTLLHGIAGVHLDLVTSGLVGVALALAQTRRGYAAAVLVGLAAAVKITALASVVPVTQLLLVHPRGATVGARLRTAAVVASIAGVVALGLGPVTGLGDGWLHGLSTPLSGLAPLSPSTQLGIQLSHLVGHDLLHTTQLAGEVGLVAVAAVALLRGRADSDAAVVRSGCLVLLASVVLSPVVHPWYLFLVLPLAACTLESAAARRMATSVVVGLALVAPLDASQHLPHAPLAMKLGVLLAVAAGIDPGRLRRDRSREGAAT